MAQIEKYKIEIKSSNSDRILTTKMFEMNYYKRKRKSNIYNYFTTNNPINNPRALIYHKNDGEVKFQLINEINLQPATFGKGIGFTGNLESEQARINILIRHLNEGSVKHTIVIDCCKLN